MNSVCLNFDKALFSAKENSKFEDEIKKYKNLILSKTINETISNFEKLTLNIPKTKINYTNKNHISTSVVCKNNENICKSVDTVDNNTIDQNQINTCSKMKINAVNIDIRMENKKIMHTNIRNRKQKNISFSSEQLWEINRVNQILHKKLNNIVKPNYTRQNLSTFLVKATSTINRERKNKDIVKENEIISKKLKKVRSTIHK